MTGAIGDKIKITELEPPTASGTTDILATAYEDMQGWDGVIICTEFGTTADTNDLKPFVCATSGGTYAVTPTGGIESDETGAPTSPTTFWLDVHRPVKRYVKCTAYRDAAQATTIGSIFAIQYKGDAPPLDNTTDANTYYYKISTGADSA